MNIHPPYKEGTLARISLVRYLSESFCFGGDVTVFDPKFVANEHRQQRWQTGHSVFDKNTVRGSGMTLRFPTGDASSGVTPAPIELGVQVFRRNKMQYPVQPASIFCPTLQMLCSFAEKKMPREFRTPAIAEVAVPIFAKESREWDKPITAHEIKLPRAWHIGENRGYGDEELIAKLSTPTWPLTLDAVRKLRTRNGFKSSPKLLMRNAPEDDAPKVFKNRINEILEATGQPTANSHHLHRLLGSLFLWGFDLGLIVT